ncbi:MAG: hypothetical protein ACK4YO_00150, partial [Candidatus Altarchaeaceae archaeon]
MKKLIILVFCILLINSVFANYAQNPEFIKICPNGKVLNENEELNLTIKIFNIYDNVMNANITVSLPEEFKNNSFTANVNLIPGFNNFVFPLKVKENVQYKGDNVNIIVDGNGSDWINVTRSKSDDVGELKCQGNISGSSPSGYDIKRLKVNYNESSDKIYFLIETNGKPGDSDGNGDPDTGGNCMCPGFCNDEVGVGIDESYRIFIDNDGNTSTIELEIKYNNNNIIIKQGNQAINVPAKVNFSDVVEFEILNASQLINLTSFNVMAYAESSIDGLSEDHTEWYHISFCESRGINVSVTINIGNETITRNLTYEVGCVPQHQYCGDGICNQSINENCINCCDCFEIPNISLSKSSASQVLEGGNIINFTINVKNNGVCPVYNISIIDIMPASLTNLTPVQKFISYLKGNEEYIFNISANSSLYLGGDDVSIIVDGNGSDWINVTRSKSDDVDELKCQG